MGKGGDTVKHKTKRPILLIVALSLLAVLGYAVFQLVKAGREYALQEQAYDALQIYRPSVPSQSPLPSGTAEHTIPVVPETTEETAPETTFRNETILQLQADHPNALGWITVPGTPIDYPIVQGPDNDYFLHRDVDGNYLYAGVPFLDYRCAPDLSGPNTVIYGHNMRNGSMFNALGLFRNQDYFDEHREIIVFLADRTVCAEIAACLIVDPDKKDYLYAIWPEEDHLSRVLADARRSISTEPDPEARFITLSTCGYDFDGARIVLVGIIRQ